MPRGFTTLLNARGAVFHLKNITLQTVIRADSEGSVFEKEI